MTTLERRSLRGKEMKLVEAIYTETLCRAKWYYLFNRFICPSLNANIDCTVVFLISVNDGFGCCQFAVSFPACKSMPGRGRASLTLSRQSRDPSKHISIQVTFPSKTTHRNLLESKTFLMPFLTFLHWILSIHPGKQDIHPGSASHPHKDGIVGKEKHE